MFKIKFLPYNLEVTTLPGETIIDTAMRYGIHINASCGGAGVCNKCKIIIEEGKVKGEIIENNFYKACATFPLSDLVVRIPIESYVDKRATFLKPKKRPAFLSKEIKKIPDSPFKKLYFKLPLPTIEENFSDWTRIKYALEKKNFKSRSKYKYF